MGGSDDFLKFKSAKFAKRCGARAIRKSKSLKTERFGRLFEVQVRQICKTLWREGDSEVKIVKNWKVLDDYLKFKSAKFAKRCGARAVRKSKSLKMGGSDDFLKFNAAKFAPRCSARAIWKSKPLKHQGPGPLFEVQSAFCVASARISTKHPYENCSNVL